MFQYKYSEFCVYYGNFGKKKKKHAKINKIEKTIYKKPVYSLMVQS